MDVEPPEARPDDVVAAAARRPHRGSRIATTCPSSGVPSSFRTTWCSTRTTRSSRRIRRSGCGATGPSCSPTWWRPTSPGSPASASPSSCRRCSPTSRCGRPSSGAPSPCTPGELLYSQQHRPQVSIPLTARGYDAYQPIYLKSARARASRSARSPRASSETCGSSEMNSTPADLTVEEVSIPARERSRTCDLPTSTSPPRPDRANGSRPSGSTGACNAFWQLHLQGDLLLRHRLQPLHRRRRTNPTSSVGLAWHVVGDKRSRAASRGRSASMPARAVRGQPASAHAPRRGHAPVAWSARAAASSPIGGHPTSISCPRPARACRSTSQGTRSWRPPGPGGRRRGSTRSLSPRSRARRPPSASP